MNKIIINNCYEAHGSFYINYTFHLTIPDNLKVLEKYQTDYYTLDNQVYGDLLENFDKEVVLQILESKYDEEQEKLNNTVIPDYELLIGSIYNGDDWT